MNEPSSEGYPKAQVLDQLKRDIEQFTALRTKVTTLLIQTMANVEKYGNKLSNAKAEFSRELYGKKLKRHQRDMQELLLKGNQIDLSIKNFKDSIAGLECEEITTEPPIAEGTATTC